MSSPPPGVTPGTQWLPARLLWAAVLAVVCLGGAGLAAAADRPHTQDQRPELSGGGDSRAAPWLATLQGGLESVEADVADLSAAGRRVLIEVSGSSTGGLEAQLAAGDEAATNLPGSVAALAALRDEVPAGVVPWRLGDANRARLALVDEALRLSAGLPATWAGAAAEARAARALLEAIGRHDDRALAGVHAGSEGRFGEAAAALEEALAALDAVSFQVAAQAAPLADWLGAQRRHDEALLALYRHVEETGTTDDEEGSRLRAEVDDARQPLPTTEQTRQQIVAEAHGRRLGDALSDIEEARGVILEAIAADADESLDGS
ncbi:MAG TPA: hypothetical protein VMP67_05420 [Candidatus Limnocylindria bacterium]|nr:hypothetical protein [Candidatus Limnocylindria bacterium]